MGVTRCHRYIRYNMFRRLKLKYFLLSFLVIFLVDWNVGLSREVSEFASYIHGGEEGNTAEVDQFLVRKKRQYAARRDRVNRYCSEHRRDSSFSRNLKKMLHNPELNITVCLIPKVASTTWLGYFAALENKTMVKRGDVAGDIMKQRKVKES